MVAFARNLSGNNKQANGSAQSRKQHKPKQHTRRNPLDRGLAMPTREMKLHIGILDAWLSNPVEGAKLTQKDREGMQRKLDFYRRELARRDERDNRPLSGDALAQKFERAAVNGRQNGFRVQHA